MCQQPALGCCNDGYSLAASAALPPAQNATAPALALGFARTAQAQSSLGDGAVSVNIKPLPFIGFLFCLLSMALTGMAGWALHNGPAQKQGALLAPGAYVAMPDGQQQQQQGMYGQQQQQGAYAAPVAGRA
jgi:hypothetical protein